MVHCNYKETVKLHRKIQNYTTSIILNSWFLLISYRTRCLLLSLEPLCMRQEGIALTFLCHTAANPRNSDLFVKKKPLYATRQSSKQVFERDVLHSKRFSSSPLVSLTRDLNHFICKSWVTKHEVKHKKKCKSMVDECRVESILARSMC